MFGNNCIECWDWLVNFLHGTLTDTSTEGLFKSLIVLTIIVIGLYMAFSIISHVTHVGANLVRKTLLPVTFITLVLLSLTVISQFRKDKTCKFSIERYLTQCTPKKSGEETNLPICPEGASFSASCKQIVSNSLPNSAKKSTASWEAAATTPAARSWDTVTPPPKTKSSTTKVLKTQSTKTTNVPKSCNSSQKTKTSDTAKKSDCDSSKNSQDEVDSSKAKERDYSKE